MIFGHLVSSGTNFTVYYHLINLLWGLAGKAGIIICKRQEERRRGGSKASPYCNTCAISSASVIAALRSIPAPTTGVKDLNLCLSPVTLVVNRPPHRACHAGPDYLIGDLLCCSLLLRCCCPDGCGRGRAINADLADASSAAVFR